MQGFSLLQISTWRLSYMCTALFWLHKTDNLSLTLWPLLYQTNRFVLYQFNDRVKLSDGVMMNNFIINTTVHNCTFNMWLCVSMVGSANHGDSFKQFTRAFRIWPLQILDICSCDQPPEAVRFEPDWTRYRVQVNGGTTAHIMWSCKAHLQISHTVYGVEVTTCLTNILFEQLIQADIYMQLPHTAKP